MEASPFYGKPKALGRTRVPPEDGSDDSCLNDSGDDDTDYNHPQLPESLTEQETSNKEDGPEEPAQVPSKTMKRSLQWSKTSACESYDIPEWKGFIPESDAVRSPIDYSKGFLSSNALNLIMQQSNLYAAQKIPNKASPYICWNLSSF